MMKKTAQQFGNMFYFTNKIESATFFRNLLENLKERMVLSLSVYNMRASEACEADVRGVRGMNKTSEACEA